MILKVELSNHHGRKVAYKSENKNDVHILLKKLCSTYLPINTGRYIDPSRHDMKITSFHYFCIRAASVGHWLLRLAQAGLSEQTWKEAIFKIMAEGTMWYLPKYITLGHLWFDNKVASLILLLYFLYKLWKSWRIYLLKS